MEDRFISEGVSVRFKAGSSKVPLRSLREASSSGKG